MQPLKYTIIKNEAQYNSYCKIVEELDDMEHNETIENEIELLTLLIKKWDEKHNTFQDADPVELLHHLMTENNLKAKDLADILKVSKGLVSDILHYKKGFSKEIIRRLSERFKISQEAFNRSHLLKNAANSFLKDAV